MFWPVIVKWMEIKRGRNYGTDCVYVEAIILDVRVNPTFNPTSERCGRGQGIKLPRIYEWPRFCTEPGETIIMLLTHISGHQLTNGLVLPRMWWAGRIWASELLPIKLLGDAMWFCLLLMFEDIPYIAIASYIGQGMCNGFVVSSTAMGQIYI